MKKNSSIEWILRIGVFGTFIGHGLFAVGHKAAWLHFLTFWGIPEDFSWTLMTIIGLMDIVIAISALVRPVKALLIYATIWAFLAAAMRPISGGYILDFVERAANWATPLALYWVLRKKDN